MGMFDWYLPERPLRSPQNPSVEFTELQGKDGPNGLFVWKEGIQAPIDQRVDQECAIEEEARRRKKLPDTFEIYDFDEDGVCHVFLGICENGVWTRTEFLRLERIGRTWNKR